MADYLVFNDVSGAFVVADEIQAIFEHSNGSRVLIKGNLEPLNSPLKPRELLRRLTIMRYKRENGESTHHPNGPSHAGLSRDSGSTPLPTRRASLDQIIRTVADQQSDET